MTYLLYNGSFIKEEDLKLPFLNRGFLYGDGFFETLVFANGELKYFSAHFNRLIRAAKACNVLLPEFLNEAHLKEQLLELVALNKLQGLQRIRITCWRSGLGLFSPEINTADMLVTMSAGQYAVATKPKVEIFRDMYKPYSTLSFCKTLSANIYVQASLARQSLKVDDMIILGDKEFIAECTSSNIFFIKHNQLYTPSLETGCIEGIMRGEILKWCTSNSIPFHEIFFSAEALEQIEMVFTGNVTGLSSIGSVGFHTYSVEHDLFTQLKKQFNFIPQ